MTEKIITQKILINSLIAGGLVFFGAFMGGSGNITFSGFCSSLAGFGVAFLTQLKQELEPMNKKAYTQLFNFY
jgi:hypothetical protein